MNERTDDALLARFADRQSAENAMAMIEAQGPPARRVDLIPPPTRSARFTGYRLLWGGGGAVAGAVVGGVLAAIFSAVMHVEAGMIVGGPAGVILTGVIIGGLLLGTVGVIAGFALGEARAPKEVAEHELREGAIPGEAFVRVCLTPGGDPAPIRATLERAGALSVGVEAHSPWPDERVLESRRVRRATA